MKTYYEEAAKSRARSSLANWDDPAMIVSRRWHRWFRTAARSPIPDDPYKDLEEHFSRDSA